MSDAARPPVPVGPGGRVGLTGSRAWMPSGKPDEWPVFLVWLLSDPPVETESALKCTLIGTDRTGALSLMGTQEPGRVILTVSRGLGPNWAFATTEVLLDRNHRLTIDPIVMRMALAIPAGFDATTQETAAAREAFKKVWQVHRRNLQMAT